MAPVTAWRVLNLGYEYPYRCPPRWSPHPRWWGWGTRSCCCWGWWCYASRPPWPSLCNTKGLAFYTGSTWQGISQWVHYYPALPLLTLLCQKKCQVDYFDLYAFTASEIHIHLSNLPNFLHYLLTNLRLIFLTICWLIFHTTCWLIFQTTCWLI